MRRLCFFQAGFDNLKATEMMAANESFMAAYCRLIAIEINQILLHKLQSLNSQVWALYFDRKLHFLEAYGS